MPLAGHCRIMPKVTLARARSLSRLCGMISQAVPATRHARPTRSDAGAVVAILAIAFSAALLTFGFFENFSTFVQRPWQPALTEIWIFGFRALLVSAPLLWLIALAGRTRGTLGLLEVHAALYGVLFFITLIVDSPGHSSPGE